MTSTASHAVIIPCAAEKLTEAAAAVELYCSKNFGHILGSAMAHALDSERVLGHGVKVLILSALHGLVELGEILAPYNVKMGQAGSISAEALAAQLAEAGITEIDSMLPSLYRDRLQAAIEINNDDEDRPWITFNDAYEAAPGIGFQRGVASSLNRTNGLLAPL